MYWIWKLFAYLPLLILYPTKLIKQTKIPKKNVIFVSNHRSNMDAVLLHNFFWFRPYLLAKKELFKGRFRTSLLKYLGAIPVNRDKLELASIKQTISILKKGKKLIIFPEGTRNKQEDSESMNEIKYGAITFALKTKSPLIPIWIKKTPKIFKKNKIIIGKPINLSEYYDKKVTKEDYAIIAENLSQKILELAK